MKRAVRMVLWLVSGGSVVLGGMGIGLEIVRHRMQDVEIHTWKIVLNSIVIVAGLALMLCSGKLAERLTDDFDE